MIRRSIAAKIGLSIVALVVLDLSALFLSVRQLMTRVLQARGATGITFARAEEWLAWAAIGAVFVALGLTVFLSRRLARPLVNMIGVTQDIGRGRYAVRVPVKGEDEVARLGAAINALASHLQRLDATRKDFLTDVAHELRTPLTYMRGYSQVLYDGMAKSPAEARQYLQIIHQETERLERLVQDLFVLAQADAGMLVARPEEVDLAALVGRVVERFRPSALEKGVRLAMEGGQGALVEVDSARMEQAVVNLLDNALRHTPAGGSVTASAMIRGERAEVVIQDSGSGIPEGDLPFIWERMYRADKSRSREGGGAGLGLAIVKNIVELHGGSVFAENREGGGTSIHVSVPVVAVVRGAGEVAT